MINLANGFFVWRILSCLGFCKCILESTTFIVAPARPISVRLTELPVAIRFKSALTTTDVTGDLMQFEQQCLHVGVFQIARNMYIVRVSRRWICGLQNIAFAIFFSLFFERYNSFHWRHLTVFKVYTEATIAHTFHILFLFIRIALFILTLQF